MTPFLLLAFGKELVDTLRGEVEFCSLHLIVIRHLRPETCPG